MSSAKILFSSAIAAIVTFILISELVFSSPVKLIIGIVVFVVIFMLSAVFTRTLNKADVNSMRAIVNGLGSLRKPLGSILDLIEKLISVLHMD